MWNLSAAKRELFRRTPDEWFASLTDLVEHCRVEKAQSRDRWLPPQQLVPSSREGGLGVEIGTDGAFLMNDWSFTQLCSLAVRFFKK
jgi:hypothetical protein